jgi:hypothetical protein
MHIAKAAPTSSTRARMMSFMPSPYRDSVHERTQLAMTELQRPVNCLRAGERNIEHRCTPRSHRPGKVAVQVCCVRERLGNCQKFHRHRYRRQWSSASKPSTLMQLDRIPRSACVDVPQTRVDLVGTPDVSVERHVAPFLPNAGRAVCAPLAGVRSLLHVLRVIVKRVFVA